MLAATRSPGAGRCATCDAPPGAAVGDVTAERVARMFKALGDPTRVRLLSLIAGSGEACICDLTDAVRLSQPTVSHHMKLLTDAGLVTRTQRGKWAYYRIADGTLSLVTEAITAITAR